MHHAVGWGMQVAVSLGDPVGIEACRLEQEGVPDGAVTGRRMVIGVPHFVTRVPDLDEVDVSGLGPPLRHHAALAPDGANINWLADAPDEEGAFPLRTYERGVESETLACGTGSAAAAVVAAADGAASPVLLRTRAEHHLRIWFNQEGGDVTDLWLEGPVSLVYRGILGEV